MCYSFVNKQPEIDLVLFGLYILFMLFCSVNIVVVVVVVVPPPPPQLHQKSPSLTRTP